jgi:CRISPR-associated protein Cmr5
MRTMAQKRAEYALKEVLNLGCDRKEFKTFSAGAPSVILQNGFGQTLAFFIAKGTDKELNLKSNDKHIVILNIIRKWLVDNGFAEGDNEKEFIENIAKMDQQQYLLAQEEILKLLEWVRRYANADLGGE